MTAGSDVVELRPDTEQYGRWFRRGDPVLIGLACVLLAGSVASISSGSEAALMIGVVVGTVAVGLLGVIASMRTASVLVGPGRIEHRSWWVRHTVLTVDDDLQGVLAPYTAPIVTRQSDLLVIRAARGGPRIRLNGAFWRRDDLARIADAAGIVPSSEPLDVEGFERRVGGIMYVWEKHWLLAVLLGGCAIACGAVGLAVLLS
ncbi:hypothetical protein [Aeromicrobium wangtongii]|uniref:hypothetical protein n=1 Tax=Aeromicrobium wangtongii TaxID=2969247 RepID=UPI0020172D46|nr:hypothetical protein [Aeromicrobium wangtongii]MCL3818736.1 hypothetical protein [Aeromicrobium wangtongii]